MIPRIAIPEPTSDAEYNAGALPLYLDTLRAAGAEPVLLDLSLPQDAVARELDRTQGVLLPGSRFDIDPERYGEKREPLCGPADPLRAALDELLLQDAFLLRKPVLGICQGAQSLNVWRGGTLVQDLQTPVAHRAGRETQEAHSIEIANDSRLAACLPDSFNTAVFVNSTHHQSIRVAGDNLRVVAVSPADGVVEAVELDASDHFVVGVQWHPERSFKQSAFSQGIFGAFLHAASLWQLPTASLENS